MLIRLKWFAIGACILLVVGLALGYAWHSGRAARQAEAARLAAVRQVAEEIGAHEATARKLAAKDFESAELIERLTKLQAAGGRVSSRVKIVSGEGVVRVPCPPQSAGLPGDLAKGTEQPPNGPESGSPAGTPTADAPSPFVPVKVGPATVECGVVDGRWWACSDVAVLVTPPGDTLHLALNPAESRFEIAPSSAAPVRSLFGFSAGAFYQQGAKDYRGDFCWDDGEGRKVCTTREDRQGGAIGWRVGLEYLPARLATSGGRLRLGVYGDVAEAGGDRQYGAGVRVLVGR